MDDRTTSLWKHFETTGLIEDYINYIEFRRLLESEFANETDKTKREQYGRKSDGTCDTGDRLQG